jgi:DNA-directed RNA polymerase beta' subunit
MIEHGEGSESRRLQVLNDGLINQIMLKVCSNPDTKVQVTYNVSKIFVEMNMHMPQSAIAETELRHLAAIPYQIISPAGNSPIIGIYQDSLLGSYRFTRSDIKFTPREAMNLLMMFNNVDTKKLRENGNKITNFDILSQILPPITMVYKTKLFEDNEEYKNSNNVLEIRNGKFVRGQMEKSVLGSSTKGIIHRICNDFNNMASANFIDDLQNIITEYMKSSSFSVGISDLIADKKTAREIVQVITTQKMEVQNIIDKVHLGIFENNTAQSNNVEFETQVNNMLNKATEQSGKIGRKSLSKDNRFLMIVNSGSKGSLINISQMISCLGQQNVDGKRIPYGFDSRTLPHYSKFDDSPKARGFIENSYITGLTAPELFFHAMGGRIGLIDTACKSVTWETPVVIMENDKPIYIEIGRWIDNLLEKTPEKIKHYTDRQMELLDTDSIYIPTTDENGNVSWGEITAVTRHDPGDALYEIKTHGGRSVIVTESKSLLIWNPKTKTLDETSTPDIKIGDCVPVTGELCKPPTVLKHIDVVDYLPKTEFVYGTDFNMALSMMKTEMQNKKKIPANWWDSNNSKHFTLPYSKKASLQRTSVRSNTENIKDGYVYPYHAQRKDAFIPEKFELNEENGIFLGLYLAEGHSHNSHVTITNNNENIRDFVKSWFDKHNIVYSEKSKINKIGGLTTTVIGNSSILSKFLLKLVGHKAENKHVPTEAFTASNEFIIGLLNGYYSGDGSISKNSIEVGSASQRLIEGISMLCSRLGIFGRTCKVQMKKNNLQTKNIKPTYRLSISAHWACKFADQIELIEEVKNHKLKTKKWNNKKHMNFDTYNNVVLDKITEINILGIEKYPKVYDLTIPSTLNFGLANGLQVRDTSQTGYIQRRLIKGLEDLKVEYDMTVRNSKGKIVQFAYGDDGFESTRVENQVIPLVGMSVEDIYMHYDILGVNDRDTELLEIYSKGTIARIKKQRPETRTKCKSYIEKMLLAREEIVKNIFKYKNENGVKLPVAFQNIITNIQGQLNLGSNTTVDITPMEAFEIIETYFEKIRELHYVPPTELFEIMYYYYLTPKDLLVTKRFHRKALVLLLETIVLKYKQAIVHPGEMVGVIAGQSIGEPTTQLTLNSVIYETEIAVRNSKNEIKKVQIGDFIKEQISKSTKIEYMEDKDTTYAELDEQTEYYEVPGATEDGQTVWRRIEAVTQHPVINEDGTNTMLKVTTKGCREIVATKAKSFLQLVDGKIIGVNGSELKVGDYLPVSRKTLEYTEIFELDLKEILPPTKYIYGTEIEKACNVVDEHQWWSKHANKTFTIPYKRSDSAYSYLKKTCGKNQKIVYEPGFIYTKTNNISNYKIPEKIELDYDFGYLLGAYCAEGCMTKHQISIANIDDEYYKPILRICKKFNLTTKNYTHNNKGKEGWTSKDIRIYSTILCNIIDNLCGKLSHNKYVSDKIVFSNKQCICGFLDAYISGDGTVSCNKNRNHINACSTSYNLLLNVQIMMKQVDVTAKIYKCEPPTKDVVFPTYVTKLENIHQCYSLRIANQQCNKLANLLNLTIQHKQDKILLLREKEFKLEYCKNNLILPNIVNGKTVFENRNDIMMDLEFDEIVSIEEVANTTNYAYDLTVEDTRNFDCINGVCLRDTFHHSGVASKSNVTRGVPRIEEILRLTKNPKNPSLTVHLKPLDELEQEKAIQYANMMEHTKLIDVVKSLQICFDPQEESTLIEDDKLLMEQYYEFENMVKECNDEEDSNVEVVKSKWIIRMEMDAEVLLDKNITMDDIHFAIKNSYYGNDITCVYSDYNSEKLVFRIRMNSNVFKSKKSKGFSEKGITDPLDQSDDIYLLKNFQDSLLNNIVLRGVNGIENVIPRKLQNMIVKEEGKYVKKDVWILDTTGSNLMETLAIDFIDNKRTYSNDIKEVFDVLGIEAARQVLYNEFVDVMEFSDVYINYHHLSLLCDRMTCTKNMVSIFRSGILNDNIGPIAKGTFEVHTEVFLNAARHADFDHMRGVSANVMMGQVGYYGTNAFNLVLDMKETEKLTDAQIDVSDITTEIEKMFITSESKSDICSKSNIVIQNNIANIKQGETKICDDDYNMGF